jgi:alkylated DNA repair dioxygenase AlkB
MVQASLFDTDDADDAATSGPPGMRFVPEWLGRDEEAALLEALRLLPLKAAQYKQYTARRRVASFGGQFDYDNNRLLPAPPVPAALEPLRQRVADWLGVPPERFSQMLVAEYAPGTPLGWHRDVPDFESIVGVSLGGDGLMRFRPYPPPVGRSTATRSLLLPPRSVYVLEGPARWAWQHSVAPTPSLRYSVSLRTARGSPALLRHG